MLKEDLSCHINKREGIMHEKNKIIELKETPWTWPSVLTAIAIAADENATQNTVLAAFLNKI